MGGIWEFLRKISVLQTNRHARCFWIGIATQQAVRLRCPRVNGFSPGMISRAAFVVQRLNGRYLCHIPPMGSLNRDTQRGKAADLLLDGRLRVKELVCLGIHEVNRTPVHGHEREALPLVLPGDTAAEPLADADGQPHPTSKPVPICAARNFSLLNQLPRSSATITS